MLVCVPPDIPYSGKLCFSHGKTVKDRCNVGSFPFSAIYWQKLQIPKISRPVFSPSSSRIALVYQLFCSSTIADRPLYDWIAEFFLTEMWYSINLITLLEVPMVRTPLGVVTNDSELEGWQFSSHQGRFWLACQLISSRVIFIYNARLFCDPVDLLLHEKYHLISESNTTGGLRKLHKGLQNSYTSQYRFLSESNWDTGCAPNNSSYWEVHFGGKSRCNWIALVYQLICFRTIADQL